MSKIFEVRSVARDNGKVHCWGASHTRTEAATLLTKRTEDKAWAHKYHDRWWIEEIDTTGMFVIPPAPPPRDRYTTKITEFENRPGTWNSLHVEVFDESGRVVAAYDRNHPTLYRTFEPFRQGDRMLALISSDYTATSVIDLVSGNVIAAEEPNAMGFCPTGFYVPDWWDINDGSLLPGSMHWNQDDELPKGDFGFVWGCIWGDDSSWKVQYLDLSRVQQGIILRDGRYGYVELATHPKLAAREFIDCSFHAGKCTVTFSALTSFDLHGGVKKIES